MAKEKRVAALEQRLTQTDVTLNALRSIRGKLEEFRRTVLSHLSQKQIDDMLTLNAGAIGSTERLRAEIERELKQHYGKSG